MEYLLIIALLAVGLFLLLMEIFIPSYGLLTIGAAGALITGLVLAFRTNLAFGIIALLVVVIILPIEIVIGVKLFPGTWIGRKIVLRATEKTKREERSSESGLFKLEGREGRTTSVCRPAGVAEIDGERVDVVAEGMTIDAGRPVEVIRVEGNRVVVREKSV